MKLFTVAILLCGVYLGWCSAATVTNTGPYSQQDYRELREKCGKILNTSPESMQAAANAQYHNASPDMACLIRCIGILGNFYDDEIGINWNQVERQLQGKQGFEAHRQAVTECEGTLTEADYRENICNKSYLTFLCVLKSHLQHVEPKTAGEIY